MKFESSNISSADYDPQTELLLVEFRNGATYEYLGVSPDVWQAFNDAPSKGRYLNQVIKPGCPVLRKEED